MSYLNFDKSILINLERSLYKEMIRTNRAGAYNSTTLIDCNTRKYHGQLVLPLPELGRDNYVLLRALNETVIQHGAEFNLGINQYEGGHVSPNGHKYIRQFDCEVISRTVYRVGGVVLSKERMLVSFEPRVLIKYTLLEAHSPTTLRFRPFLAFRSVNELTHANDQADKTYQEADNGIAMRLYPQFPQLFMQFSKQNSYAHDPNWYHGIEYFKERERGLDSTEDLLVPGCFELPMKKGESIIFSAGITPVNPRALKGIWKMEMSRRIARTDMFATLKNSAAQFYKREGGKCTLLAGYPWFHADARCEFMALPGCTLSIDRPEYWDVIMNQTAVPEIMDFINNSAERQPMIQGMEEPDALLWAVVAMQRYAEYASVADAAKLYGKVVTSIISFIRKQQHPRMFLHNNGLLYVDGTERPATWMNAVEDGRPITPRTGYVVEINALWYDVQKFAAELERTLGNEHAADLLDYQAEITRGAFISTFWNGLYLDDYVIDNYHDKEVRSSQIWAIGLPYSPLDRKQQKSVLDICTKELLTPRGLRSLSPKSGSYRGNYTGSMRERDRNYHNGPVWPLNIDAYVEAYVRINKLAGRSFIERLLLGYEAEMSELCIGTINELYDGNPPFKGHGGMSYAPSVAAVIRVIKKLEQLKAED